MPIEYAQYHPSSIEAYQGNPLIQALPDYPSYMNDAIRLALTIEPEEINPMANRRQRAHWLNNLYSSLFIPLGRHLQMMELVDMAIRHGYHTRNPLGGDRAAYLREAYTRQQRGEQVIVNYRDTPVNPVTMAVLGCSGAGKSLAIEQILGLYPHVLRHRAPRLDFDQIVYLMIECPGNGSIKSLCGSIISEVDRITGLQYTAQYAKPRSTYEELKRAVVHLLGIYRVGILVIDEIQNLIHYKGNREEMFNFIVSLSNSISVPVLFVGTPKVRRFMQTDMRVARRFASFGSYNWLPLKKNSKEWTLFYSELAKKCVLKVGIQTQGKHAQELEDAFYDETQGVTEILVKLFIMSQMQSMVNRQEQLTAETVRSVARQQFGHVAPMIQALREQDKAKLSQYEDLRYSDEEFEDAMQELQEKLDEDIRKGDESSIVRNAAVQKAKTMLEEQTLLGQPMSDGIKEVLEEAVGPNNSENGEVPDG